MRTLSARILTALLLLLIGWRTLVSPGGTSAAAPPVPPPPVEQRALFEKTYSLTRDLIYEVDVDPPAAVQRLTVSVTPATGPVGVWLIKTDQRDKVIAAIETGKVPPAGAVFAHQVNKGKPEAFGLQADIPAGTGFTLLLQAVKVNTRVRLKLVGTTPTKASP